MYKKNQFLDELYERPAGETFMSGIQALVRLPMAQRALDKSRGLKTAGLVTGYRGSPLGAYDQQLWKAEAYLKDQDIVFQPGLNEDLAATALWGAQMHKAYGASDVDGVFGVWYGKGNGVDRTGDVFRNANTVGTSALGGVLAVGGDDHAAQSSMFPHQTDGIFQSVMMPVLQPSNISEILSLGLAGISMSRFSGLWVSMKTVAEVVESAAVFDLPNLFPEFRAPDMEVPARGFGWDPSINWPAERLEYERRMYEERLPAASAWAIANQLDYPVIKALNPRFTIITVGKAHQDVMQALENLGLSVAKASEIGISVYKVAMSWPLASSPLLAVASGSEEILVVEEKAPIVEDQIKAALFNHAGRHPRICGKVDEACHPLLPVVGELTPDCIAAVLLKRLKEILPKSSVDRFETHMSVSNGTETPVFPTRKPFFCAGCPHNSSTKTPDGSMAGGGIGCHIMALSLPKLKTDTFSQMGGEGAQWIGAAPFSSTGHIFQNIGDGTYQHSGLLAIRAAVAAGTNITFKILFNDAVAMTGGQVAEGTPDPVSISKQLVSEGVGLVYLVSDDPEKWHSNSRILKDVIIRHRDEMDAVQRHAREVSGVTAIIYEQTCAAEKRRRRKRGTYPDPDKRLYINPRVCEGCGDCSVQSNCIAVEPLETDFGRKRKVNQSSCNKDFSCLKGFCPSFVEIDGPVLRKPDQKTVQALEAGLFPTLPEPVMPALGKTVYNIYVAGIGGLGVLTTGSLLGTAAFRAGLKATVLDFTGLAQKNGAVVSQVRVAPKDHEIHAVRIGTAEANLFLGADMVVAASNGALRKLGLDQAAVVLNTDVAPTADSVTDRDAILPADDMVETLMSRAQKGFELRASSLAEGLFGNVIAANMMLLGYAWQQGLLPITQDALLEAILINGAAVELNKRAFMWGRCAAVNLTEVEKAAGVMSSAHTIMTDWRSVIQQRYDDLVLYQNQAYADRYQGLLERVKKAAAPFGEAGQEFVQSVARNAYKLMAYKDEYEVARLYSEPAFMDRLKDQFSGHRKVSIWLSPPLIARPDPNTGRPVKIKFGPWILPVFRLLARFKFLRATWADPFGKSAERKGERALRDDYFQMIELITSSLVEQNLPSAIRLAELPDMIRGYGPVKEEAVAKYQKQRAEMFKTFQDAIRGTATTGSIGNRDDFNRHTGGHARYGL